MINIVMYITRRYISYHVRYRKLTRRSICGARKHPMDRTSLGTRRRNESAGAALSGMSGRRSARNMRLLVVLALIITQALVIVPSVPALTSTTITIDGSFDDWTGVRADPTNVAFDTQYPMDPDWPGQPDRDIFFVNATYDSENLYLSWRRTAGGVKAMTVGAYIDLDGDGLLQENRDVVVAWTVSDPSSEATAPGNYDDGGRILHYYQARDKLGNLVYPAGDPMDHYGPPPVTEQQPPAEDWEDYLRATAHGDGNTPDGWALGAPSWGETFPVKEMDAFMDPISGIEIEAKVAWTDLGFSADQVPPLISMHFVTGNGDDFGTANKTSLWSSDYREVSGKLQESNRGQVEDNVKGLYWLMSAAVDVSPDNSAGGSAGTTLTYEHTVTNGGNSSDTFDLSVLSSQGWTVEILDEFGDPVSEVTLDAYSSTTVQVRVTIPPGASSGTEDETVLTATSQSDATVTDSATDTTQVGQITVTPDQYGSTAAGEYIEYEFTVQNNLGGPGVFDLSSTSTLGFDRDIFDLDGNPISTASLASGETTTVVMRVSVPADATVAMQDVSKLTATLQGDPTVTSFATATTTVRDGLTITPDNSGYGGAGTWMQYTHTITNSWPTSRTVALSGTSSEGWDIRIYADDGVTQINSIDMGPNGDTEEVIVRVFIPYGTAEETVDTTTITATAPGSPPDTATDTTTVRRLTTYADSGFVNEEDQFIIGDDVFARATGLSPGDSVYWVWVDSDGTVVRTTVELRVDTQGMAFDNYTTLETDPTGDWTVLLYDSNDNLLEASNFTVSFDAEITALSATDASNVGDDVDVTSSVENNNTANITDSTMTYVIWWDDNASGTFDAGDIYIDDTGAPVTWDGITPVTPTHVTTDVDVAGGGTWTEATPWSVNNAEFPNQGTYNVTATWTELDGTFIDEAITQFYSVPTMGWPLLALALTGVGVVIWRRRHLLSTGGAFA